jgi:hypothetical protein
MNLTRRNICRLGALLIGPAYLPSLFGMGNQRRDTLHPPEPAGQEFDMLLLRGQKSRNQAFTCLRERRQEFSRCLKQLIDTAAKLDQMVAKLPVTEVFSIQVYKEAELLERLVKQIKRLSKD